ncbi:adenine nucleotide alpha hydrolases-like protein [Poronia punctata]|nr:adenine nucleotide alpha hydrolases-like protein [Poronia punctata]
MASESLSVIALVSGGKDSFYSILHCQANGHRVVALANLYPSRDAAKDTVAAPEHPTLDGADAGDDDETDLNSFMYQTVGHQIIPLYAAATGLPLYRQPIVGTAVHHGLSYQIPDLSSGSAAVPYTSPTSNPIDAHVSSGPNEDLHQALQGDRSREIDARDHELADETESLVPLLQAVLKSHPEANALCTGAILSTYQRTRVESVALRLGLVPLSYLWQFTELPAAVPGGPYGAGEKQHVFPHGRPYTRVQRRRQRRQQAVRDDARLLREMAAVGLDARIIKVASAGLDESFLWEKVTSEAGVQRVERAIRRFGGSGDRGTILGEGGEFETLVVDGPYSLFKGRIVVPDENRRVIREGGGCSWLSFHGADVVMKSTPEQGGELQMSQLDIPIPPLLDPKFEDVHSLLEGSFTNTLVRDMINIETLSDYSSTSRSAYFWTPGRPKYQVPRSSPPQEWCYLGSSGAGHVAVEEQIIDIVDQIRQRLGERDLPATAITNSIIVLRRMSDFPLINEHYGSLFRDPNPPSRVTISCGEELLPAEAAVAVYLTVHLQLEHSDRRGLHVQSRSYWAPANIGPYSQAIAFPLLPGSPLAVSVAGQIPLVPASMKIATPSSTGHFVEDQITLGLQHLWRVGTEMQVRWWTSAVAYFTAPSVQEMRDRALLAATAWKAAHTWPDLDGDGNGSGEDEDEDSDEDGPDLWDRKFNPQFMTYGGGDEAETFPLPLPDWDVLDGFNSEAESTVLLNNKLTHTPFFFAAQVEELPRQAAVEWHAHLGLAAVQSGSVKLYSTRYGAVSFPGIDSANMSLHHVVVKAAHGLFVQTSVAVQSSGAENREGISTKVLDDLIATAAASLERQFGLSPVQLTPKITYASGLRVTNNESYEHLGAFIPCKSLWDAQGLSLSVVCIFETRAVALV